MSDALDDLRNSLGAPPGAGEEPSAALPDFSALQAAIANDLDTTQGPWRKKGAFARYWPAALAVLVGIGAMFIMPGSGPPGWLLTVASGFGAFAMGLCTAAFAMAPDKPSLAERMAKIGLGFAVVALGFEGAIGVQSAVTGLGNPVKCATHVALFALPPLVLLFILSWQAKSPLRRLHVMALAASAMSVGGVTVWRHCSYEGGLHIFFSHVLPVVLGVGILGILFFRLLQPKRPAILPEG